MEAKRIKTNEIPRDGTRTKKENVSSGRKRVHEPIRNKAATRLL